MGLSSAAAPLLARYGELLLEKNQVMNLTAITELEQVARLHMLDCAALLLCADFRGKALIDVGTGAGFPGLVIKILEPSVELTLLDSQEKRLTWLGQVCAQLGLEGVRLVHGRAEEMAHQGGFREKFDLVTARAVASMGLLCELCLPYVRGKAVWRLRLPEDWLRWACPPLPPPCWLGMGSCFWRKTR